MRSYRDDTRAQVTNNFNFFNQGKNLSLLQRAFKIIRLCLLVLANGRDIQQMINTHLEASKIGQQVADQAMDYQRRIDDTSAGRIHNYNFRQTTKVGIADNSPHPNEDHGNSSNNPQLSSGDNSVSGGERPLARYIASPHQLPQQRTADESGSHSLTVLSGTSLVDSSHQGSSYPFIFFYFLTYLPG